MSAVHDLVSLMSFLVAHDGIRLRDAAKATGRSTKRLIADLERLMMCGVPPYSPSDYMRYSLNGRGDDATISVFYAQQFARPLSLTPQEAMALKFALDHYSRATDPSASELAVTLQQALRGRSRDALEGARGGFVTPPRTQRMRKLVTTLTEACEDQQLVEIDYYSSHRASLDTRKLHPFGVLEIGAHFYLYAYCALAGDTRHFRLDRIRDVRPLDIFFDEQPPKVRRLGRMESLFDGKPRDVMQVRFTADVARDVIEEWAETPGVKVTEHKQGGVTISLPLYNSFWAVGFVMGFGRHAELLGPDWLRKDLVATLKKSLKAHKQ
jgi:proteasome accessory factor C